MYVLDKSTWKLIPFLLELILVESLNFAQLTPNIRTKFVSKFSKLYNPLKSIAGIKLGVNSRQLEHFSEKKLTKNRRNYQNSILLFIASEVNHFGQLKAPDGSRWTWKAYQ